MANTPSAKGLTRFNPGKGSGEMSIHKGLANTDTAERKCANTAKDMNGEGTYSPKSAKVNGGTLGMRFSNDK